ncbi:cytochrome c oxidase assembly factor, partial [Reticulomyxa filosa]
KKKKKKNKQIKQKYGFSPAREAFKQFGGAFVQFPVHIASYNAISTMYNSYPDWKVGGALWFKDLSAADPYWALPAIGSVCAFAMTVINFNLFTRQTGSTPQPVGSFSITPEAQKFLSYIGAAAFLPIGHWLTSGFNLYVISNIVSFALQTHLIRNAYFRRFTRMPTLEYETKCRRKLQEVEKEVSQKTQEIQRHGQTQEIGFDRKQRRKLQSF